MELSNASNKLSKIDLKLMVDNLTIDILWFRVMQAVSSGWCISRHTHSSFEFHFVYEGSCKVKLDKSEFIARKGEFYLTAPGVFHEQSRFENNNYTEFSINCDITPNDDCDFDGSALLTTLLEAPCCSVKDKYNAIGYFYKSLIEADEQRIGCYSSIKSLTTLILISAARAFNDTAVSNQTIPLKITGDDYRLKQINQYIEDNLAVSITTKDLSHQLYLSERQINRIITHCTGKSTKAYINSMKMSKAKILLRESDYSIKEIAQSLGFSSEYYFNQFFKRLDGYPPGFFRKNVRNH